MKAIDPRKLEKILNEDARFQALQAEHRLLDEKIDQISQKHLLTPEEELEKKQHQKLKLKLKDQMAEIERVHRSQLQNPESHGGSC
ncbi:MAG: DUF465 domain-containing protein [Proteobacteria bacterium]|nr:DUF465 domain-containing protein [Pseudomonadota bacterium]